MSDAVPESVPGACVSRPAWSVGRAPGLRGIGHQPRARAPHRRPSSRAAVETLREQWPDANALELHGGLNSDWVSTLRIQRVVALDGRVLYDAAMVVEDEVGDMIDEVGVEYLDLLLDLTGDDFMGAKLIEARFLVEP